MMKKNVFLGLLLIIVNFSCKQLEKPQIPVEFSNTTKIEIDSFLSSLKKSQISPGLAIAIIKNDSVYYHTTGYSSLKYETQLKDTTSLFMGNLSEPMLSFVVLRLAESGKLNLDSPVVKYLPYFKLGGNYRNITIKHLMTQTSGIPNHSAKWDFPNREEKALSVTTKSIALQPPLSEPGTEISRSAYNYDILADLIRNVVKTSFEQFVQDSIFNPLNLHQTSFDKSLLPANNIAKPHKVKNWLSYEIDEIEDDYPYNKEHSGSIGLHSSIRDMSQWMFALLHHGNLLNKKFLNKTGIDFITSPHYKTDNPNAYIGLGWEITTEDGKTKFRKNHQLGGFSADMLLIPAEQMGILVFANIGDDFDANPIINHIHRSILTTKKFPKIKIPAHIVMGKEINRTGHINSGFKLYNKIAKDTVKYDLSVETLSKLGVNYLYKKQEIDNAITVFQFTEKIYPKSNYARLNLAEAYILKRDYPKTKDILKTIKLNTAEDTEMLIRRDYILKALQSKETNFNN